MLALAASATHAREPRPWLCRDKPVFSSNRPMNYDLNSGSSREWDLFLMQFSPDAAHDGFAIVQAVPAPRRGSATGHLEAGRYFVVALYHKASGSWICPGYAHEQRTDESGVISNLCFADGDAGCPVRLTVRQDESAAPKPPGE